MSVDLLAKPPHASRELCYLNSSGHPMTGEWSCPLGHGEADNEGGEFHFDGGPTRRLEVEIGSKTLRYLMNSLRSRLSLRNIQVKMSDLILDAPFMRRAFREELRGCLYRLLIVRHSLCVVPRIA